MTSNDMPELMNPTEYLDFEIERFRKYLCDSPHLEDDPIMDFWETLYFAVNLYKTRTDLCAAPTDNAGRELTAEEKNVMHKALRSSVKVIEPPTDNAEALRALDDIEKTLDALLSKPHQPQIFGIPAICIQTIRTALLRGAGEKWRDETFKIGDIVQVSQNCKYWADWAGINLEIVGIYRERGNAYTNTAPPIKYAVKEVTEKWSYGYTDGDGFSYGDLVLAPPTNEAEGG